MNRFRKFVAEIYRIWIVERPGVLAASLAYYAIFSFVPIVFIAFAVAGVFINELAFIERFYDVLSNTIGDEAALMLQESLAKMGRETGESSALVSVIGFIAILFTASLMFFQLQYVLNTIWRVPPPARGETGNYIKNRFFAFLMVLGVGVLLTATALINVVISFIDSLIDLPGTLSAMNTLTFLGLATLAFALMFKVLPNAEIRWRDVWIGSIVTALLTALGGYLLALYLGVSRFNSASEAAGTVTVLLMAFYFFAQIFVFGAVFTRVYAVQFGSNIVPKETEDLSNPGQ